MPIVVQSLLAVIGRTCLAAIFLLSPIANLLPNFGAVARSMQEAGVPLPRIALAIAIVLLIAGSLSLIAGYRARIGALLLIVFLIPATFYFHAPWKAADSAAFSLQLVHFLKNLGLFGAMLLIMAAGAGPASLDRRAGR